jgi:hypothetical protein
MDEEKYDLIIKFVAFVIVVVLIMVLGGGSNP